MPETKAPTASRQIQFHQLLVAARKTWLKDALSDALGQVDATIVKIVLANDPDVRVHESVGNVLHNKLAIEIKGGTDKSNAHNRAGEAEKSHLKATKLGFAESAASRSAGLQACQRPPGSPEGLRYLQPR